MVELPQYHGPFFFRTAFLEDYRETFDRLSPIEQCILSAKLILKTKLSVDVVIGAFSQIIQMEKSGIDKISELALAKLATQTPHRVIYKPTIESYSLILFNRRGDIVSLS